MVVDVSDSSMAAADQLGTGMKVADPMPQSKVKAIGASIQDDGIGTNIKTDIKSSRENKSS